MDDFDDFDNSFDEGDFMDDESNGEFYDDNLNDETQDGSNDEDDTTDIGWDDMAVIGGMAEEFAEEEKERLRLEKKSRQKK